MQIEPDLEAVVHVFDFRMTQSETFAYIEETVLPERLVDYIDNDLLKYALVANCLTYIQRAGKRKDYQMPVNVASAAEIFELLKARGIFVDLLSNKEVCNMTAATFSRDDIIRYQGKEEGIQLGMRRGMEQGVQRGMEQATILAIRNMLELGMPEEKILLKYSQKELDRAKAETSLIRSW